MTEFRRWIGLGALALLGLGCSCSCDEAGDDDSAAVALAEMCWMLQDEHFGDGLRGCADPDCADQPMCQVSWASDLTAGIASVEVVPEAEQGSVYLFSGAAGPWIDLDGDGVADTVITVSCLDTVQHDLCADDVQMQFGQFFVSGADFVEQPFMSYPMGDALLFSLLEEDDIPDSATICAGTTAALDMDGDGVRDLVATHPYPDRERTVQLWWGGADAAMPRDPDAQYDHGRACAVAVAAGDLDGDGREDLAMLNGPAVSGYIGLELGGDRAHTLTAEAAHVAIAVGGSSPTDVHLVERAGDFVGDDMDDLVVVMRCSSDEFGGEITSGICYSGTDILVAVFAGRTSWPASLTLEDADVAFAFPTGEFFNASQGHVAAAGDVNGDGFRDLVYVNEEVNLLCVDPSFEHVRGVGWVFPGTGEGWTRDGLPDARFLLSASFEEGERSDFGHYVHVADLDSDGMAEIVVSDGSSPPYAEMAEHFGLPYGDTGTDGLEISFHIFRGSPELLGEPGSWAYPSHIVLEGEENMIELVPENHLSLSVVRGRLDTGTDFDGDGAADWVNRNMTFYVAQAEPVLPNDRTVVDILSGAALLEGF